MHNLTFDDGIHDITNEQYHASSAISRSKLTLFDKSPYHFWYEVMSGEAEKKEATPAMVLGSAFHTLLLEPHLFDNEYCLMPNINRRTNAGKEEYAQFCERNRGKTILTVEQYEQTKKMAELVKRHDIVDTLLDESVFEKSIFWTDQETGLQFKTRPDIWSPKMVVDVKTTSDASLFSMTKSALHYGYFLQAGMTYEACKQIDKPFDMFVILAIEKTAPYVPAVFIMNDDAIQHGIDVFQGYKRKLKECLDKNKWPGYPVQELAVPQYAVNQLKDEE